jgi:hypothetical protein
MASDRSGDDADRPAVCVDTLDYDGAETHQDTIEGEVTRHYYDCPNCGHPISTWMDCLECLWYDEDVWTRTLDEEVRASD